MQNWKKFPRVLFYVILLAGLLAGVSMPLQEGETVRAAPMQTNFRDVIISEVAWGGTAASDSDEWIELYNSTGSIVDVSNWKITFADGSPVTITIPNGKFIQPSGYFLLERVDSAVSDIPADYVYGGANMGNTTPEVLSLVDNTGFIVDTANSGCVNCWYAGSGSPDYYSMERTDITADSSTAWKSNDGNTRNGWAAGGLPIGCTPTVNCTTDPQRINGTPHTSQVDLSLAMTASNLTPDAGDTITFTITVSNINNVGYATATNIQVKDLLPSGFTHWSNTPSMGTYDFSSGDWIIGSLPAGATATLTIDAIVKSSGSWTNIAEVWSTSQVDADSTPGNASSVTEDDNKSVVIVPTISTDLSLTQSVSNTTPGVGSTVTFSINVENKGPDPATGVQVKNSLPAGMTFTSSDGGAAYNIGSGTWTVGTLSANASKTLNITASVDTKGAKTNQAEVLSSDQPDPDVTNNKSSITITPVLTTLTITNDVNTSNPKVGSNVVFTIKVVNDSTGINATGVSVSALLPYGLKYISYSSDLGSYNGITGLWTIGALSVNTGAQLIVTAQVITTTPLSYSTTVSSNELNDSTATVTFNNGNPLSGEADLSLSHDSATPSTSTVGQVSLKLRLHNAGPDKATNVQVKDLLPEGLNYYSSSASIGSYSSSTGIWAISELPKSADPTQDAFLNITVKVAASGTSTKNFAEVWRSDQYDPDSTPGNDDIDLDDDTSLEVPIGDLSLFQTVDVAGGNAIFRITIRNNGPDDVSDVTVKNSKLATNYSYISHGVTVGTYDKDTGNWVIPTLLDGDSAVLTVTTTFSGTLAVNWAQVSSVNAVDPDSRPGNCSNTLASCTEDDDAGAPSADLYLTQSVNNVNPNVGDKVVFSITVHNDGIADTTGVQVKDLLPSGLSYVSHTVDGTYTKSTGIWKVDELKNGSSKTLKITATVSTQGIRSNAAEVWKSDQDDPDSKPANGSTVEDDYVSTSITSYRSVIINEIAWAGTAASGSDEWIELYNPTNVDVVLTGWKIRKNGCTSGSDYITLVDGTKITKGGFFLLERGSSSTDNSTVSDVAADQIYLEADVPALSNSGETLFLCDKSGNFIDTANKNGGSWPKGGGNKNASMERQGTGAESDDVWTTNVGTPKNGLDASEDDIYGTPRRANSKGVVATPAPTYPPPTPIPPVGRPVINEFLARPGYDWNQDGKVDVFDEFIEIKNIGAVDINIGGWRLDDEANQGSSPFTLPNITLKPGEHAIFYGLETNILLSDGGDTVRLLNSSGKVYDAYTYEIAKVEDQSVCRLPDGHGSWYEDCVPTPNRLNSQVGEVPSMPDGEEFESPVCDLPDTLHPDFLFAECRGYGADIWRSFFWDQFGWQGSQTIYQNMSKWESFVE